MRTNFLLVLLLMAVSVMATTHILALQLSLYWLYPWLDIPMHALGGAVVALAFFALGNYLPISKKMYTILYVLMAVLSVGFIWEAFELSVGLTSLPRDIFDTVIDLCMDIAGGIIGYAVSTQLKDL